MSQAFAEFAGGIYKSPRRDVCLAALSFLTAGDVETASVGDVKAVLVDGRVPKAKAINVPDVLGKATQYAVVVGKGDSGENRWRLTSDGRAYVSSTLGLDPVVVERENDAEVLRAIIAKVSDKIARGYLEEGLLCYQVGALKAAIVFVWSGAMRIIQEKVLAAAGGAAITAALVKHDPKAKKVATVEDFANVRDALTLQVARDLGVLDKGQWTILSAARDVRNQCGHPTNYNPGVKKSASFLEDLVGIVFI